MIGFLVGVAICSAGGLAALMLGRWPKACSTAAILGLLVGGTFSASQCVAVLLSGSQQSIYIPWPLPLGSVALGIDPLSAVFALAILLVTPLSAVYGAQYLQSNATKRSLGPSWFFFNLLAASMLLVVAARDGVLFLMSWELLSLTSFLLVMHDDEKESVRRAGWIYLAATHLGTAFLIVMFLLLGTTSHSLNFARLSCSPDTASIVFLLALIGFGTKAGFVPLHVWLPEAHPAAPSHVSAVMSGVMIKTGIYGLLRILMLFGEPPAWWGWTLVAVGLSSGIFGALNAVAQHDLKRLLAYCSIENVGIIALGLGIGMLGVTYDNPTMATLGFAGSLLHIVNHAVFKSLLFLGAGSVLHATGTAQIDRLGGLLKRMPVTGSTFIVGAAAISGLPPLNGFVSEFIIYLAAMSGISSGSTATWPLLGIAILGGLAVMGGLAAAAFTKAVGIALLGEPRTDEAAHAHDAGALMRWPMLLLAGLCVLIGLAAPWCPTLLTPVVLSLLPIKMQASAAANLTTAAGPLVGVTVGSCLLLGFITLAMLSRRWLLAGRSVGQAGTWDCGYVACSPRMQYTASSFSRPLVLLFRLLLQPRDDIDAPQGLFPKSSHLGTRTPDVFRQWFYDPLFRIVAWTALRLRWLQQGRIQIYVLYIALTILALLIWKLG